MFSRPSYLFFCLFNPSPDAQLDKLNSSRFTQITIYINKGLSVYQVRRFIRADVHIDEPKHLSHLM